jgi:hypothetical protein
VLSLVYLSPVFMIEATWFSDPAGDLKATAGPLVSDQRGSRQLCQVVGITPDVHG